MFAASVYWTIENVNNMMQSEDGQCFPGVLRLKETEKELNIYLKK